MVFFCSHTCHGRPIKRQPRNEQDYRQLILKVLKPTKKTAATAVFKNIFVNFLLFDLQNIMLIVSFKTSKYK